MKMNKEKWSKSIQNSAQGTEGHEKSKGVESEQLPGALERWTVIFGYQWTLLIADVRDGTLFLTTGDISEQSSQLPATEAQRPSG